MTPIARLITFAKVVELASFSAAARALGLTKSTASKHVADLEQSLGVALLDRTSRRVVATDAGRALHERCADVLAGAERALEATRALGTTVRGTLRVFSPTAFGQTFLSPLLADLLEQYPQLELQLMYADRPVHVIEERFDVAIQLAELPDSSLHARRIGSAQRHLCAAVSYLEAHGAPRSPDELVHHQCLVQSDTLSPTTWTLRSHAGEAVAIRVHGRVRSTSSDALLALMERGHGIAYPPTFATAEGIRAGRLRAVLPDWVGVTMPVFAVTAPGRARDPKTRAFIDFVAARLAAERWSTAALSPRTPREG